MCGHSDEHMVKDWVLNEKGKKKPVSFLVDGYEPEPNTVYQFHECHWHGYTSLKNCTKRQQKRDRLIKTNGWDTKYNLVLIWGFEEPILKKVTL